MLNYNIIKQRCLILSKDKPLQTALENTLSKAGYIVDTHTNRKKALSIFLQYRHALVLIDEEFLPKYPYRLLQFYKMAHRTPGIIILKRSEKNLSGYCLLTEGFVEVINIPIKTVDLLLAVKQIEKYMLTRSSSLFYKDLLIHIGLAVPLMLLLTILLSK